MKSKPTEGVETMVALGKFVIIIKKQQKMIKRAGFDPEWELFENTFGWFQMKEKMTQELQELYKEIWDKIYKGEL